MRRLTCSQLALHQRATQGFATAGTFFPVFRAVLVTAIILGIFLTAQAQESGGLQMPSAKAMVQLTNRREGNIIRFFAENLEPVGVTATFELGLVNLKGNTSFPFTVTLPPRQKTEAFTLWPVQPESQWSYTVTNHYTLGDSRAVHDTNYLYRLPYASGQAYRVTQAFHGGFSHTGGEQFAIDWRMPEGTPVLAARGGTVILIKDDSSAGGPDRRFENDANYVLVQHSDGTIGNYAHLMRRGVTVALGQAIQPGQLLGYSGNTGYSSGPHLHFSVFKPKNGKERESIPIRFSVGGRAAILMAGQSYEHESAPLLTTNLRSRGAGD